MKTDANGQSPVCVCTAPQIRRYLAKISGPLLDRIDTHIEVPRLSPEELMGKRVGESSCAVHRRVVKARAKQLRRMGMYNGHMKAKELREHCDMDGGTKDLLKAAIAQFNLSGRGYDRILKVSRTIADLEGKIKSRCTMWQKRLTVRVTKRVSLVISPVWPHTKIAFQSTPRP